MKDTKNLLEFWETQMKQSHRSSNYFFRKSPSHYHMMLLVMSAHKNEQELSVEELKTIIITEAVEKGFFHLEKTAVDQRKKFIKPTESFVKEFDNYITTLKNLVL